MVGAMGVVVVLVAAAAHGERPTAHAVPRRHPPRQQQPRALQHLLALVRQIHRRVERRARRRPRSAQLWLWRWFAAV